MKLCPRCEKTAQRYFLTRCCGESEGKLEVLTKPVYGTFNDSCNSIASSIFFALIKFSLTLYRMREKGRKYVIGEISSL